MKLKNKYLFKKKLFKWVNTKQNNLNTYNFAFFFKKRKTPGDTTILHLYSKNLDDMIHSS